MEIVFQPIYHRLLNVKENIFQQFISGVKRSTIKEFRGQVHDSLRLVRESQSRNPTQYFLREEQTRWSACELLSLSLSLSSPFRKDRRIQDSEQLELISIGFVFKLCHKRRRRDESENHDFLIRLDVKLKLLANINLWCLIRFSGSMP